MAKNLTRKDIAEAAGVSPSTVSRALAGRSDLLPESTIEHIKDVARNLGYKPNILAKRLATNKSYQIGFAIPSGNTKKGPFLVSYYSGILDAVTRGAGKYDYTVSIHPFSGPKDASMFKELIDTRQIDGLIFAGLDEKNIIPEELLKKRVIPMVIIGSKLPGLDVTTVNFDPAGVINEMLSELEKRDYKRLFYVSGNKKYYDAQIQHKELIQALKKSSIELVKTVEGSYSFSSGHSAGQAIKDHIEKGDVVFLANDRMATGFYHYCYDNGIRIPEDIGVIGSDDDYAASTLYPSLATIKQPRIAAGEVAIDLLMKILGSKTPVKNEVLIKQQFIVRNSIKKRGDLRCPKR